MGWDPRSGAYYPYPPQVVITPPARRGLRFSPEEYKHILAENWKGGPEGLTHEGLFGALFFRARGDWITAAKYAFDVAEAVNEQAVESGDAALKELSLQTYELAEDLAMKAGRTDVAKVAALRATALRGGPKPMKLGGL